MNPVEASTDHRPPHGITRIAGRLIDTAVVLIVFSALRSLTDDGFDDAPSLAASLLTAAFALVYEVGLVASKGATLGKLALGMRVIDRHGTTPPSVGTAVSRWAPNALAIVPIIGPLVALAVILASLIWVFTDPRGRSIFDRAGHTRVVMVR